VAELAGLIVRRDMCVASASQSLAWAFLPP
jgi:hypothetical protein